MNFKLRSWATVLRLIRSCPMVLEVVDARDISATRVQRLERIAGRKLVLVAAKSDLLPDKPHGLSVQKNGLTVFYTAARTHSAYSPAQSRMSADAPSTRLARVMNALTK